MKVRDGLPGIEFHCLPVNPPFTEELPKDARMLTRNMLKDQNLDDASPGVIWSLTIQSVFPLPLTDGCAVTAPVLMFELGITIDQFVTKT